MITQAYSRLEKRIAQIRREIADDIGSGACKDYAQYRDQCGYLRGLQDALSICEEIEKQED